MSYILTALKKAEQARDGQGAAAPTAPQVGDTSRVPPAPAGSSRLPWLGLLAVMAVMIALLLIAISQSDAISQGDAIGQDDGRESLRTQPPPPPPPQTASSADLAQGADPVVASAVEPVARRLASVTPPAAPSVVAGMATDKRPVAPAPATVVPSQAVTPAPTLNITGYIFFENNPAASKLFVDGIVYRLGSSLGDSMTIREFKPDRVIVSRRGAVHEVLIP